MKLLELFIIAAGWVLVLAPYAFVLLVICVLIREGLPWWPPALVISVFALLGALASKGRDDDSFGHEGPEDLGF